MQQLPDILATTGHLAATGRGQGYQEMIYETWRYWELIAKAQLYLFYMKTVSDKIVKDGIM